jgi:hypothetical protein
LLTCRPSDYDVYRTPHYRAFVVAHRPTGQELRVTYGALESRTGVPMKRLCAAADDDALLERAVVQLAWERLLVAHLETTAQRDDYAVQIACLLGMPGGGSIPAPT